MSVGQLEQLADGAGIQHGRITAVHNHTFIHLRGVCADVLLDGAPHGHHAGVLAQRAERQLGPQVAQRLLSHATDFRAARQLNSRVRVRLVGRGSRQL